MYAMYMICGCNYSDKFLGYETIREWFKISKKVLGGEI